MAKVIEVIYDGVFKPTKTRRVKMILPEDFNEIDRISKDVKKRVELLLGSDERVVKSVRQETSNP